MDKANKLTTENYLEAYLEFQDRQAGVSLVYCPDKECYTYNVYCVERKVLKELLCNEFDFLDEALDFVNQEFSTWELKKYDANKKKSCSDCAAK